MKFCNMSFDCFSALEFYENFLAKVAIVAFVYRVDELYWPHYINVKKLRIKQWHLFRISPTGFTCWPARRLSRSTLIRNTFILNKREWERHQKPSNEQGDCIFSLLRWLAVVHPPKHGPDVDGSKKQSSCSVLMKVHIPAVAAAAARVQNYPPKLCSRARVCCLLLVPPSETQQRARTK